MVAGDEDVLRSSFGALLGSCLADAFPSWHIQPGMYALIGATAVLGGVFRSSISLVVIVLEGTGGIDFVFTIIVAIAVSNWVAAHIHHEGLYESDLDRDSKCAPPPPPPPPPLAAPPRK